MKRISAACLIAACLCPVSTAAINPSIDPEGVASRFGACTISGEKGPGPFISASDERRISSKTEGTSTKVLAETANSPLPKYVAQADDTKDRQLRLARAEKLEALVAQLGGFLLPEPPRADGMMSSLALAAANLRLVGEALPRMRTVDPLLVAYIESRLLDSGFAGKVEPLLGPGLSEAGATLLKAYREHDAITITLGSQADEQRRAIAELNIPGKLDALEQKISTLVESLGILDPAVNPRWKQLLDVLRDDLVQQLRIKTGGYRDEIAVEDAMRKAYWYAVKVPDVYETAYLELKASRERLRDFSEVFFRGIRPGTTPTRFLLGEADVILSAMKNMDAKMVQLIEPLMQREDRDSPLRGLDGLFNLRRSIRRQADALRYGQQVYGWHLLVDIAEAYMASNLWTNWGERSIWSGRGDFDRVKLSYNKLREYGERWRKDPKTPPLCALVEIDSRGVPVPTLGGWLQWRWLGADDVSDLEDEGRIVSVEGRRWVVPPGVSTRGVVTVQALLSRVNISELVTVLDLNKLVTPRGGSKQ